MPVQLATHEWPPSTSADAGTPAPVAVLVHGITGWWRTWWRLGPALADRGWRVIAIDQRGHGGSPAIDGVATAVTLADDLAHTIDRLNVAPVDVLVAHSLGAAAAMELIDRRPAIARRLVLEDPPWQSRVDDLEFQANLEREVVAARTDPDAEVQRELAENPDWLVEDARQDVEGRQACDVDGIVASLRNGTQLRVLELVPTIELPTLYLLADQERSVIGPKRAALKEALPQNATLVEFDSGHTVHRDRFDAYLRTLVSWLDNA